MNEFGSSPELNRLIPVNGNRELIVKKLKGFNPQTGQFDRPPLNIAFLVSEKDMSIYVSPDNSHIKAAQMAGLPSNNSKEVLLKGRIVPMLESFDFINNSNVKNPNLINDADEKMNDHLVPDVVSSLKDWLGSDFYSYATHYKTRLADGKKSYDGD